MLDSASSVPANIAEGHARSYTKEYLQYVAYAHSSLKETETHLWSAVAMRLVTRRQIEPSLALAEEVSRMLAKLKKSLKRRL